MKALRPFHLAVPVRDLEKARSFYRDLFEVEEGRSSQRWVDFNFFGHQFVIHEVDAGPELAYNPVDKQQVPVPHYGVVLEWDDWQALKQRCLKKGIQFVVEPYVRFEGEIGEQATMFFLDPSGNALEFKAFKHDSQIFAK